MLPAKSNQFNELFFLPLSTLSSRFSTVIPLETKDVCSHFVPKNTDLEFMYQQTREIGRQQISFNVTYNHYKS